MTIDESEPIRRIIREEIAAALKSTDEAPLTREEMAQAARDAAVAALADVGVGGDEPSPEERTMAGYAINDAARARGEEPPR